jgi:hypothetical protein
MRDAVLVENSLSDDPCKVVKLFEGAMTDLFAGKIAGKASISEVCSLAASVQFFHFLGFFERQLTGKDFIDFAYAANFRFPPFPWELRR